jgi:hypothetical protein
MPETTSATNWRLTTSQPKFLPSITDGVQAWKNGQSFVLNNMEEHGVDSGNEKRH